MYTTNFTRARCTSPLGANFCCTGAGTRTNREPSQDTPTKQKQIIRIYFSIQRPLLHVTGLWLSDIFNLVTSRVKLGQSGACFRTPATIILLWKRVALVPKLGTRMGTRAVEKGHRRRGQILHSAEIRETFYLVHV